MPENNNKPISHEDQTKITKAIIKAAVMMLEYGAESKLIERTAQRLGNALGVDSVEMALIPSAIVLTTLTNKKTQSVTTTRRAHHKPINMSIVCDVQKICIDAQKNSYDVTYVIQSLRQIEPNYYNPWLIVFMIALSCASISILQGGDSSAFFITFLSAGIAMYIRQQLARKKMVLFLIFAITAFVATIIASSAYVYSLTTTPSIVLAASVVLLFPGFPFVNSFLDAVKGYLSMGWGRWMQASLLTFSTTMGIILAMSILNIKGW